MNKKNVDSIVFSIWFVILFFLWVIITLLIGTNGQWWSIYRLNPQEYGPWALHVSEMKMVVAGGIFLLLAYVMTFLCRGKR
ncbi:hypothetical protein COJ21_23955 [Priestia megaterium]|nr:hypothetical protein COJ21_23955 [Priestia megaterium]